MITENKLTPDQVQQLVDAIREPVHAYLALKDGSRYTKKQQQQLVDRIAKSDQVASWALQNITWLTDILKGQLKVVA